MTVEISDERFRRFMDRLDNTLQDPTPILDVAGNVTANLSRILFDKSRDPYGTPWMPIKHRGTTKTREQYTDRQGRKRTRTIWIGGIPLRATGTLANSINHVIRGSFVVVGPGVEYGIIHQLGLGHVHQRAFLPTPEGKLPSKWTDFILDAVQAKIRAMTVT